MPRPYEFRQRDKPVGGQNRVQRFQRAGIAARVVTGLGQQGIARAV